MSRKQEKLYSEGFFVFCPAGNRELTPSQIADRFGGDCLFCKTCANRGLCREIFKTEVDGGTKKDD